MPNVRLTYPHRRLYWAAALAAATLAAVALAQTPNPTATRSAQPQSRPSPRAQTQPQPDAQALAQAMQELAGDDWLLQSAAMRKLVNWKVPTAAATLRSVLTAKVSPWVRGQAMINLAQVEGEVVLPDAQAMAADASPVLRAASAEALGIVGGAQAVAAVEKLLNDQDPSVRVRAATALARLKGPAAWNLLSPLLKNDDPRLVAAAAEALVYIPTPEATASLVELLAHPDKDVRISAAGALGALHRPEGVGPLLARVAGDTALEVQTACYRTLAAMPDQLLLPPLLQALRSDKKELYGPVIRLLGERKSAEGAKALAELLVSNPKQYVEAAPAAMEFLSNVDADAYAPLLSSYLTHQWEAYRWQAVWALSKAKKLDLFATLAPLTLDPNVNVRNTVYGALRKYTRGTPPGGIVPYLAPALASTTVNSKAQALELLKERLTAAQAPAAVAAVQHLLTGADDNVRRLAAKAIEPAADEATARKIAALQGYLIDWKVIGTWLGDGRRVYPIEEELITPTFDPGKKFKVLSFHGGYADIFEAASNGQSRPGCLRLAPPVGQSTRAIAQLPLSLPQAASIKLSLSAGLQDVARAGLLLEVRANDQVLISQKLEKPGWNSAEADLSALAGKYIHLRAAFSQLGEGDPSVGCLADFKLLADGKPILELPQFAATAGLWTESPTEDPPESFKPMSATGVNGWLTLQDALPTPYDRLIAYAVAEVNSPTQRAVAFQVESRGGYKLWLNGKLIDEHSGTAAHPAPKGTLSPGSNRIVVKVSGSGELWGVSVRVAADNKSDK